MLLAFAVDESCGVYLLHGRREDMDVVLGQRFEEAVSRLLRHQISAVRMYSAADLLLASCSLRQSSLG